MEIYTIKTNMCLLKNKTNVQSKTFKNSSSSSQKQLIVNNLLFLLCVYVSVSACVNYK